MLFSFLSRRFSTNRETVTLVRDIIFKKPVGNALTIQGWATSVRKMGKTLFVDVNDGSCLNHLQVVFLKNALEKPIQTGSSLSITGIIQMSEKGQLELHARNVDLVGPFITDNYPFNIKQKQSYDLYRQYLHFRPKIKYFTSMLRFRSAASLKIHKYFSENSFTLVHTPVLTSGDCEGSAETFIVRPQSQELIKTMKREKNASDDLVFFNSPTYLTVSGQLHLEAVIRSIAKVYTFNPCFRAENSTSRLHLSEFYMVEAEEAFITDLDSILKRIEDFIKSVLSELLTHQFDEIEYMLEHNETNKKKHLNMLENVLKNSFSVMSFSEAKEIINKNKEKFEKSTLDSFSLTKAEEIFLVEHNNSLPIFVVDWPKRTKPFYMKECKENPELVKAVDLLVPNVGELCGGSLREEDYNSLKIKLIDLKIFDNLQWYLDLRKYGNVPSGGFGLGFERFIQFLLNVQSIKDTIPFPRWPHHLNL